eukprot:357859-Chlamydomonas_euryale.AAC.6
MATSRVGGCRYAPTALAPRAGRVEGRGRQHREALNQTARQRGCCRRNEIARTRSRSGPKLGGPTPGGLCGWSPGFPSSAGFMAFQLLERLARAGSAHRRAL